MGLQRAHVPCNAIYTGLNGGWSFLNKQTIKPGLTEAGPTAAVLRHLCALGRADFQLPRAGEGMQ